MKNTHKESNQWLIALGAVALLVVCGCQHTKERKSDDRSKSQAEVKAHMKRYIDLFNREESQLIAEEIFLAPAVARRPGTTGHGVQESTGQLSERFDLVFEEIRNGGWRRTKVHDFEIRIVGRDLAFADMTFSRISENGDIIGPPDRRTASYVLLKWKSGWRIIFVRGQRMTDGESEKHSREEVEKHMAHYIELCNEDGFDDIAHEIYHEPVLWRVDKKLQLDATAEAIRERFRSAWELFKMNGWKRIVLHEMDIRLTGSDMAFVEMQFTRLKTDGTVMHPGRKTWSYVLLKEEIGWRIISALEHSDSGYLR